MTLAHDRHLQTGIAGSLAIHALLLLLIVWGLNTQTAQDLLQPEKTPEEKVPEITLVFPDQFIPEPPTPPEVTTVAPKLFVNTAQNEAAPAAPTNAKFQSDRNTVAASAMPPSKTSALQMPTLDGNTAVKPQLNNTDYQDGSLKNSPSPAATQPTPTVKETMAKMETDNASTDQNRLPLEVRKPDSTAPAVAPEPVPAKPQVRMPEDKPPQMNAPSEEEDFSAFNRMSKSEGSVSREGENAVDAVATPLGMFESQIKAAIQKKWQLSVQSNGEAITGRVRFRFYVDKKGTPQDLKILSDARDADPRMRELTLRAILDAQIPPIPADLLPTLEDGRVKIEYEAIIY